MKTVTTIALLSLLLAACGSGQAGSMPSDFDPDDVILTVTDEGGFAPVEMILGRHPRYVLQADGRLYTPGAITMIYPGPMLMPVFVGTISDEHLSRIREAIVEAGLPGIDHVEDTSATAHVADATTTVITYFDGSASHTLSVYALGIAEQRSQQAAAAAALVEALDGASADLTDLEEYRPTKVEIRTGPGLLPDPEFRRVRPWPLAVGPEELPETGSGWRCAVVEGPPARDLLDLFGSADQATVWDHDGTQVPLLARGLLPGEPGCR